MSSESSSDSIISDSHIRASPNNPNESNISLIPLQSQQEMNAAGESMELLDLIKKEPKKELIPKILQEPKKARDWQLTLNQTYKWEPLKNYLMGLKSLNYIIACLEKAPTTGHMHIHCYCQFTKPIVLSKNKTQDAHIERCKRSPQENVDYIKKTKEPEKAGEIIHEWGELRKAGNIPTIEKALKMSDEELAEDLHLNFYNIVEKIKARRAGRYEPLSDSKKVQVFYIYGPSGYGKTIFAKLAMAKLGKPYDKVSFKNDFWDGVKPDGEVAFYDEFRDSDMKPSEFIKFIDYSKHSMNIKGGSVINNYKYIFITSIQRPAALWPNMKNGEESMQQWMRRIKAINIEEHKKEVILAKYLELIDQSADEPDFEINNII